MSIFDFINYLTSPQGGALIVVAWAASWFLEPLAWWQSLQSRTRQTVILIVAGVLGLIAVASSQYPDALTALDPYFRAIANIALAWLATQAAHRLNTERKR